MRLSSSGRRRKALRPTVARVRTALFNSLGARVEGARILDLFAGSGALGMEALRRGAELVVFVEHDARLVTDLRRRLVAEGIVDRAEVWKKDALAAIREMGEAQRMFEIILLDPPYGQQWVATTLQAINRSGLLSLAGLVVAEGHWRDRPSDASGFICRKEARYGETALWYFERAGGDTP